VQDEEFDRACRFLDSLAAAMQRYGVSSSAMESLLVRVAGALRLRGQFLATPTQVESILSKADEDTQRLHVSVSSAGNYDLTKLAQMTELVGQVESGAVAPGVGLDRLRVIDSAGPEYGPWLDAVAYALCGLGFGVILGISWRDVLLGGALSLVTFGLARLAADSRGMTTALELVVATVASALATFLCLAFPGTNALAVAVCAVVYFVPGFGFTLGASELMSGNTLSGLIGFTRAAVTSGKLFVGVLIGGALVRDQVSVPLPDVESGVPHAWTWVFVPVFVLGLAVLFRVRRRDLVWPLLGALVAWSGVEAGSGLGFWQGTFIGAFLLTSASRLFARRFGLPAAIIMLPVVMVLVPGVAALRALYAAQTQGLVQGLRSADQVIALIAAILGGLLVGDAVSAVSRAAIPAVASRSRMRSQETDEDA